MKVGILRFPGTNCDRDIWQAVESVKQTPQWLWHTDRFNWKDFGALIIPGGFSFGDYLRTGALAAMSPVMGSVHEAAEKGVPVLGICNGFQILCETKLLPGVLLRNEGLKFKDSWVKLKVEGQGSTWSKSLKKNQTYKLPIAHGEGRYFLEKDELKKLKDNDQVWCRYLENPNGSIDNIAGITNKLKNIAALMPHPERALFDWMGSGDGFKFFEWMN